MQSCIPSTLAYSTNAHTALHSKELMLELFKKLQGSPISLFTSLSAQHYYLEGGQGIEMVKALADKFRPMDDRAIQIIISSMQNLTLADNEDFSVYKDKLKNYNLQLSWVGQEMSTSFIVYLAKSQLSKSCYHKDIKSLQLSHMASGSSFKSLDDLCQGLEHIDKLHGLPYGGEPFLLNYQQLNHLLLYQRKLLPLVLLQLLKIRMLTPLL
jgi:hypothetical protein